MKSHLIKKSQLEIEVEDIQVLFREVFFKDYNVELQFGASEPFYRAAKLEGEVNQIFSRNNFVRSSLHEIAHWCIAGKKRRQCDDFGYFYSPDGRDLERQKEFEAFEVKPQAIEKAFCEALGISFQVSADNLSLANYDTSDFDKKVIHQLEKYRKMGFPQRAKMFLDRMRSEKGF